MDHLSRWVGSHERATQQIRSNLITIALVLLIAAFGYVCYLVYLLYSQSIIWAVLASVAVRPFQHAAFTSIQSQLDAGKRLVFSSQSWLASVFSIRFVSNIRTKWRNSGFMTQILYSLLAYWIAKKVDPKLMIPFVIFVLLVIEHLFRFGMDCLLMIINCMYKKEDRDNVLFQVISLLLLAIFFLVIIFVQVAVIGVIAMEVSKYGGRAIQELGDYGEDLALDRISNLIGQDLDDMKLDEGEIEDIIYEYSDLECSAFINYLESFPFLYKYAAHIDDFLVDFNWSTGKIADFAYKYKDDAVAYLNENAMTILTELADNVSAVAAILMNNVSAFILFITILNIIVYDEKSLFHRLANVLPLEQNVREEIGLTLENNVKNIFSFLTQVAVCNTVIAWIAFDFFHVKLKYTLAILTGVIGCFPLIPGVIIFAPIIVYMFWVAKYVQALGLAYVSFYLLAATNDHIMETTAPMNELLFTNSIDFGLDQWGTSGVVYGPLIAWFYSVIVEVGKAIWWKPDEVEQAQAAVPVKKQQAHKI